MNNNSLFNKLVQQNRLLTERNKILEKALIQIQKQNQSILNKLKHDRLFELVIACGTVCGEALIVLIGYYFITFIKPTMSASKTFTISGIIFSVSFPLLTGIYYYLVNRRK